MQKDIVTEIMGEYEHTHTLYSAFTQQLEKLLSQLLSENGVRVHSVASRLKDKDSLKRKLDISAGESKYSKIGDVTDVCGIRIITYFADEVDTVSKIIDREFEVDRDNSVDKRAQLDPDQFGYVSLHYVVRIPHARLELTEYRRFSECVAEIQIRSILQHTWAEIEHDLGYKSEQAVPSEIRRRFSRLAGLLELADSEFSAIRDSLEEYRQAVSEQIKVDLASVAIDQDSLLAFIKNSTLVKGLDSKIASHPMVEFIVGETHADMLVRRLRVIGLQTISDIENQLSESYELLHRFSQAFFSLPSVTAPFRGYEGICLTFLIYLLVSRSNSIKQLLEAMGIASQHIEQAAGMLSTAYNQVVQGPN